MARRPMALSQRLLPGLVLGLPAWWLLAVVFVAPVRLGPDPAESLVHATGIWALRGLVLLLALPVLARLRPWGGWIRHRRSLGIAVLLYAIVHLLLFVWFYLGGDLARFAAEIVERPYILLGMAALVLMVPLGITSTRGWVRRLGTHWKTLHRLVYGVAVLAALHYLWVERGDLGEPMIYLALVLAGIAWRLRPDPRRVAAAG